MGSFNFSSSPQLWFSYNVTTYKDPGTNNCIAKLDWSAGFSYSGSYVYSNQYYGSFNGQQFTIHDGGSQWSYGTNKSGTVYINCGSTWDAYSTSVYVQAWKAGEGAVTQWVGVSWASNYSVPSAITGLAATRASDTCNNLAWNDNATAQGPYGNIWVDRTTDAGDWVNIANISGSATGYSDTTTSANHYYKYRVVPNNDAGQPAHTESGYLYNTPAAPTIGSATKTGASTVQVAWTDNANSESGFEVSRTADGGSTWASLTTAVGAGVTSYTDSSAPGGTVAYRVRALQSSGSLASAWSATSNGVTTTCAPAAPTITSGWGTYSPTGSALRIAWQHNTLDGSAQSKADVYYSLDGGSTWNTHQVTGASSYYDLPITGKVAGTVVKAQVRTYGLYASAGPYSAVVSTTLANSPQCNITTPATDSTAVTDVPLTVAWSYTDTFAQAGWTLQLYSGGTLVKAWTGTTEAVCSIPLQHLPNNGSYSLSLTVRSGSGFTASATRSFTTDYLAPAVPTITAVFDASDLSAQVIAQPGVNGSLPATDHMEVLRIDAYEGAADTEVLTDALAAGATVVDYVPRLGQQVTYRVLAVAANGAYSSADAVADTALDPSAYAWNFGTGGASVAKMSATPTAKDQPRVERSVVQFAGREKPVSYYGIHRTNAMTYTGEVWAADDIKAFHDLSAYLGDAVFRDPWGRRINVATDVDFSESSGPRTVAVSVAMQEVDG